MCGLVGMVDTRGRRAIDAALLRRMNEAQVHRGPDGAGLHVGEGIGLGHRRLAVIDPAGGHQPLYNEDGSVAAVFDGEIYNFVWLIPLLEKAGHVFRSRCAAEVVIHAWEEWGPDCVAVFDGMFAFALWDGHNHLLFAARDRMGIKPLYYARDGRRLRFASTPQALLAAGDIDTSLDPVALHHHLTLHAVVPAPRTLLNGVRKLPPATTLTVAAGGKQRQRTYWTLPARRPAQPRDEREWLEATRIALLNAVERQRLAADVPVGVLLSGGLDSSLLVGLLASTGVRNLNTFSIGFEDVGASRASEFEFSDPVAERFETRHHKYRIPNREVLQRLPEAVANMAEPMVGQDAVAFYLLAERVRKETKAVLSGQGADEVFAGYFWYPLMEAESGSDLERFRRHYFDRSHEEYLETVAPPFHGPDHTSALVESLLAQPGADTFLDRVLRMDVTTLVVDDPVKRVDNMTMAWGLEARVPFLDHELVELAAQMPPSLKLKEGGKFPLKAIARGLLPDAVIDRPKGYFPLPALKYVRGAFLEFMTDILCSPRCRERGLFRRPYVERLLADPERHFTPIRGNKLWHLALLELWLQTNVDRPAA